jgi:RNA polymerase sigma factor (sigma-70 family)
MKANLPNDHFFSLCDARDEDARQDQCLALLEAQPQSEADARAILKTLHHRHERTQRRGRITIQLEFDPVAPQQDDERGAVASALDRLSGPDQDIIRAHVINEEPLCEIASRLGISRETAWRRYSRAKKKLAAMCEIGATKGPENCRNR